MKNSLMVIPLVIMLCFTFGCQDKEAMAELEKFKAQAAVEEQNKELIRNYLEELDKGNAEMLMEAYAPNALYYFPSGTSEPISREAEIKMINMFRNAFPDLVHNIEEMYAVGDKVIVRIVARGTHKGELEGIPPTGNNVEISTIIIYRIENGKVVEERRDADMFGLVIHQLGLELKPKEEK